mmetsp:Transcript_17156/g.30486  ORF Transcript_17156/g.30486 Transcript_17156/m.30486 type:complete len:272 (+) Transcript_17156:784-1599(+)
MVEDHICCIRPRLLPTHLCMSMSIGAPPVSEVLIFRSEPGPKNPFMKPAVAFASEAFGGRPSGIFPEVSLERKTFRSTSPRSVPNPAALPCFQDFKAEDISPVISAPLVIRCLERYCRLFAFLAACCMAILPSPFRQVDMILWPRPATFCTSLTSCIIVAPPLKSIMGFMLLPVLPPIAAISGPNACIRRPWLEKKSKPELAAAGAGATMTGCGSGAAGGGGAEPPTGAPIMLPKGEFELACFWPPNMLLNGDPFAKGFRFKGLEASAGFP